MNVVDPLIKTPEAFIELLEPLISKAHGDNLTPIVVFLPPTRDYMVQNGVDFNVVIKGAAAR